MMRPSFSIIIGALLVAFGGLPALGQTDAKPDTLVTTDECEVAPADDGVPPAAEAASPDSLTETLAPCDGVLEPAPVGDEEMTITPPPVGETPVIEPDEIPPQPPQPE
jgi:hypothetical protein